MNIAIASGKGGTGKTFVSTNLFWVAQNAKKHVTLIDCDAEEPNVAEFLKGDLLATHSVSQQIPVINTDACVFCGKCYDYCSYNAIFYLPQKKMIQVNEDLCHSCGACVVACEYGAITEKEKEIGIVKQERFSSESNLIECRMEVGSYSPVPLIKRGINELNKENLNLLDSPPGISCPFIATVENVNYVVLVTEPTPFGLNDLKLSVATLRELNKPCGVVINRAGLGDRKIYDWLKEVDLPLLLEIPFDKEIAKFYSDGRIVAEHHLEYRKMFLGLLETIEQQTLKI